METLTGACMKCETEVKVTTEDAMFESWQECPNCGAMVWVE